MSGLFCGAAMMRRRYERLILRRGAARAAGDSHAQKTGGVGVAIGRACACRRLGLVLMLNVHVLNCASIRRIDTAHCSCSMPSCSHCSTSIYAHCMCPRPPRPPRPPPAPRLHLAPLLDAPPARVCIAVSAYMCVYAFIRVYFVLSATLCKNNFVALV